MLTWLRALDRILRGETTSLPALQQNGLNVPIWGLLILIDALGLLYGLCMGVFDLTAGTPDACKQTVSCMLKVPALFLLTLLVTTPSLYVFNAMVGSRLYFGSMIRLLIAALAVMLAVLASIGPIVAFFSFTTTSYPFMILLNVLIFSVAGCLGMSFLLQSLHRMTVFQAFDQLEAAVEPLPTATVEQTRSSDWKSPDSPAPMGPLDRLPNRAPIRSVRLIFQIWVIVFSLVGTQMAWVLSPFLGHRNQHFILFRPTGSNFFLGVWQNISRLTH
jgi:hypothetical protein